MAQKKQDVKVDDPGFRSVLLFTFDKAVTLADNVTPDVADTLVARFKDVPNHATKVLVFLPPSKEVKEQTKPDDGLEAA